MKPLEEHYGDVTGNGLNGMEVAVIGMAGRFPDAHNIEEFWENIKNGRESIRFLSDTELENAGVPSEVYNNPHYVKARGGFVDGFEYFDASFFGYTAPEARLMDPQLRLMHECAWWALEDAGYDPQTYNGLIGVFAGVEDNTDWRLKVLLDSIAEGDETSHYLSALISNKDFVGARVSYKLNLKGPVYAINTTCSTGLAAVHMACRNLLGGECDMALAGAGNIKPPAEAGYMYREGMLYSADGHLRAFDSGATGAIFSSGIGIIVLKNLEYALADGDHIYAVIKGSAANNDGNRKVNFTAPSVKGQYEVIKAALQAAEIDPVTIGYVETHGTGTPLGDPIEIKALTQAFKLKQKGFIPIGSVKTNIGHLDCAAGIAGLIKAVMVITHKIIPPSLNYEHPNPEIDFENSPFYVNTTLNEWKSRGYPFRVGVSSFGFGGTNIHIILEEWSNPVTQKERLIPGNEILLLSAKSLSALDKMTGNLAQHLLKNPQLNLKDTAYTLQVGRAVFSHRRMLVCSSPGEAAHELSGPNSRKLRTYSSRTDNRPVIFMFPGLGAQYQNMGLELYRELPIFRSEMNRCFDIIKSITGCDIKEILYPSSGTIWESETNKQILDFENAQIVVFILEYALAKLLMEWGIRPHFMIGYSFGEYAAACVSGVYSLADALKLIVARGKLITKTAPGAMVSVPLSREELTNLIADSDQIDIAVDNGLSCIVSGALDAVNLFESRMKKNKYMCMRLPGQYALHSKLMMPIVKEFETILAQIDLKKPQIPYIANVTGSKNGNLAAGEEVATPGYWIKHLTGTVQFGDGIKELLKEQDPIFIEVGPGNDLKSLISRFFDNHAAQVIDTIRHPGKNIPDTRYLFDKVGRLWLWGTAIEWPKFYPEKSVKRVSLPTYPFEGTRYWLEGDPFKKIVGLNEANIPLDTNRQNLDSRHRFYLPTWKRVPNLAGSAGQKREINEKFCWLLFIDAYGLGERLAEVLRNEGQAIITVSAGPDFSMKNDGQFTLDPHAGDDSGYDRLFSELARRGMLPHRIIHLWGVTNPQPGTGPHIEKVLEFLDKGFYSLIYIARALDRRNINFDIQLTVVTDNLHEVNGEEALLSPEKAVILGPVKVIPTEYHNIKCRSIDIILPSPGSNSHNTLIRQLMDELTSASFTQVVSLRGPYRWEQHFESISMSETKKQLGWIKFDGIYLITGGLGGIGSVLAENLAKNVSCKLALTGRNPLPPRKRWGQWQTGSPGCADDLETREKIRRVQALEKLGAEVMVFCADVSDPQQMREVIEQVEDRLGPIDGVIHCAGTADGQMCQRISREGVERILDPKIKGTLVLDSLLKDKPLDFFVLCSSAAAILPSFGQIAYCTANAFLDAFAGYRSNNGASYVSIAWDRWKNIGMAVITEKEHKKLTGKNLPGGITQQEGVEAFNRIMSFSSLSQVIVLNGDLETIHRRIYSDSIAFMNELGEIPDQEIMLKRPELSTTYSPPTDEIQCVLARIWGEFLGFEEVGIGDDFFELGGDSLKAIVIISRINKELKVKIPLDTFFKIPNICELSKYISGLNVQGDLTGTFIPLESVEKKDYYPLTPAQKRMYFLHRRDPRGLAYNMWYVMAMAGILDQQRLEWALFALLKRHETLRTSVAMLGNVPIQRVHGNIDGHFNVEYFNALNGDAAAGIIKNFVRPFELDRAPLFRSGLIHIENGSNPPKFIFMVDMHHIISDGSSLGILISDFSNFYNKGIDDLPPLTFQYKDFAEWQDRPDNLMPENMKRQEDYWLKQFQDGVPVLGLQTDFTYSETIDPEGYLFIFPLDEITCSNIGRITKEMNISTYMLLLSAYYVLLAKYTGKNDIVVGSKISGRTHADLENIIGIFVNMLALRNFPAKDKSFKEFLNEVKESSLRAYDNQDYSFADLVRKLRSSRQDGRNPLFETVFAMGNMDIGEIKIKNLEVIQQTPSNMPTQYDLHIEALEDGNKINMLFSYSVKLFKQTTIEKMACRFQDILHQVLENIDVKIQDITFTHDLLNVSSNIYTGDQEDFEF